MKSLFKTRHWKNVSGVFQSKKATQINFPFVSHLNNCTFYYPGSIAFPVKTEIEIFWSLTTVEQVHTFILPCKRRKPRSTIAQRNHQASMTFYTCPRGNERIKMFYWWMLHCQQSSYLRDEIMHESQHQQATCRHIMSTESLPWMSK